jgi:small-conductance mechanosensitive channel
MKIIHYFSGSIKNAIFQLAMRTMWLCRIGSSQPRDGFSSCCMVTLSTANRPTARVALLLAIAATVAPAQDAKQPGPAQPAKQQTSSPASTLPPLQLDSDAALHHLNQVISWYRRATTGIQAVGLPSDTIYEDNTKNLGAEVVRFAFQSAKAEAALIKAQVGSIQTLHESSQEQALEQMQAKTSSQIDQLQSQLDKLNGEIPRARPAQRTALTSQRDALQGELDLQKALLDSIHKMTSFVEANGEVASGLEGGINQLARSIPEVLATGPEKPAITPAPAKPTLANSGGLISEAITLYDYMSAVHQIDAAMKEVDDTRDVADRVRMPLRDAMRATIQQSQNLAGQQPGTDPQQLQTERQNFQQITERFKQLSAALIPLSQEIIVLNDSKTNFGEWRSSVIRESRHVLRSVLVRVGGILGALAVILILSEVWRKITFRYISEPRRRRQFLVLRRVVIGFLIVIVLILGFVSEFSSLATFAGFITAGIAVGLQAVLLSVAAYFFIIGRYGIRVGDRISVAGITGDVVDLGLIRFYLMEMAGTGLDFYPTGRLVVFSNAVLFQTGTPLFKQIPGSDYAWHEVVVMIAPQGNRKAAQEKLVATVNSVYSQYRQEIERQHATIERRVDIQIEVPRPEARLQFADAGLELLVRYPVEIRRAPDIDEEMTRKVLQLIETDETLKAAVSGTPKIRSAVKQ